MNKNSLKLKIFLIFSIPIIAIIYFSYNSVEHQYKKLNESSAFKLSAHITQTLSNLIYNIQIERGLGAGYIVGTTDDKHKQQLKEQYTHTDEAFEQLQAILSLKSKNKKILNQIICNRTKPLINSIIQKIKKISSIRERVLDGSISFKDEIQYYSSLNEQLIVSIKMINNVFNKLQQDAQVIVLLEQIKEYAGIERAYIYNQLLSHHYNINYIERLKELKEKQKKTIEEFLLNASEKSIAVYMKYYNPEIEKKLNVCRNGVINQNFTIKDADKCFVISSQYINIFKNISLNILDDFIHNANGVYERSINSLYLTYLLWFLSFIALLILSFLLKKLINNEYKTLEELRIASYAFDSQEAMVITDIDRNIIKVNNAFTEITGYQASQAIGEKLDILQTDLYNDFFYMRVLVQLKKDGKWAGEVYNKKKNGEVYPEMLSITAIKNEENITTHYIAQFIDISEIKKAQQIAQHQADHDFLTGLLNRKSLLQRLNEEFIKAKRHKFVHAFLFIDLDNFKSINDNYGHDVGDQLIIEIAKRLKNMLREGDIVARISGDEFGVILLNLNTNESQAAQTVKQICEKILKTISEELVINKHTLTTSSSIGIKIFPDNERCINDIIIHADKAMYEAKKQGKNQFVFFDNHIALEIQNFAILEADIKNSLENGDFKFFYQPKVDVQTGAIQGAEMLIRWQHPRDGLVFPNVFIDVAESIGVIHKFSILALHSACQFLQNHKDLFNGTLAINISSKELLHPNFETEVISIISSHNITPSKIELEITESTIIKEFDLVIQKLKKLQEFGIKFSIDDFGTGYSSITYLQKLPVNTLKIDRSFFHNLELNANRELVKMVINIAKTFHMEIVSEGIEDTSQLKFIQEHGSHLYQGFYFSKAVDEQSFIALLQ